MLPGERSQKGSNSFEGDIIFAVAPWKLKVIVEIIIAFVGGGVLMELLPTYKIAIIAVTALAMILVVFLWPDSPDANPYFTFQQGKAIMEEGKHVELLLDIFNNTDVTAENITTGVLVLEGSLNPSREPLYRGRIKHGNAEGPGGRFDHVVRFELGEAPPPLYVVFEAQYTGSNRKKLTQTEFLKIVSGPGAVKEVHKAKDSEKNGIKEYMRDRNIPMLQ